MCVQTLISWIDGCHSRNNKTCMRSKNGKHDCTRIGWIKKSFNYQWKITLSQNYPTRWIFWSGKRFLDFDSFWMLLAQLAYASVVSLLTTAPREKAKPPKQNATKTFRTNRNPKIVFLDKTWKSQLKKCNISYAILYKYRKSEFSTLSMSDNLPWWIRQQSWTDPFSCWPISHHP